MLLKDGRSFISDRLDFHPRYSLFISKKYIRDGLWKIDYFLKFSSNKSIMRSGTAARILSGIPSIIFFTVISRADYYNAFLQRIGDMKVEIASGSTGLSGGNDAFYSISGGIISVCYSNFITLAFTLSSYIIRD